ncbi:MAG: hypothetical protein HKO89_00925 [Saprospiraceae bacterium]|nr:hypothetical protein [Bacteroidia bacterium]NNK89143.1 hypothetical protein [Saprospiraceae bacterium]
MGHIFSQNLEANNYYIKANSHLKTAKTLGIVSLSSLGLGIILMASDDCNFFLDDCGAAIAGAMITIFVFPAAGITGLIFKGSGIRNKKESINLFNQGHAAIYPNDNPIELSLVLNNGIGILVKF